MHIIHHTNAVVLKSVQVGEANVRLWLFTREFGLVVAVVQGVRKAGAKLQSHVSDYSFITADLVQGKEVWRLISSKTVQAPLAGNTRHALARAYVRTLTLLGRFLIGEGAHEELYDHVLNCANALGLDGYDPQDFDAVSIWKMLVLLGYIAPREDEQFILAEPFLESLTGLSEELRKRLVQEAQQSIAESHL